MIITKKSLSRRTVLRGLGAGIALPLLDSMVPALTAAPAQARRLGAVYVPNGMSMPYWRPRNAGPLELSPTLKPLAAVRDQVLVLSGMDNREAEPILNEGDGDHSRAQAAFLTGAHAMKASGVQTTLEVGVSMDQIAARHFGKTASEMIGKRVLIDVFAEDADAERGQIIKAAMAGRKPVEQHATRGEVPVDRWRREFLLQLVHESADLGT